MGLQMGTKVGTVSKSSVTELACKRFLAGVRSNVACLENENQELVSVEQWIWTVRNITLKQPGS